MKRFIIMLMLSSSIMRIEAFLMQMVNGEYIPVPPSPETGPQPNGLVTTVASSAGTFQNITT